MYYRMKKIIFLLGPLFITFILPAQTITDKLTKAFTQFEKEGQLKSALASLYVVDGNTGKVLFSKNSLIGLAPASTQKIITSATAYDLLGKNFQYSTSFSYSATEINGKPYNTIYITPGGDPTLGSWRWKNTAEEAVLQRINVAFSKIDIKKVDTIIVNTPPLWDAETIPGGWPWDDIGNYYGAGADALNWRENQYDLVMKSGSIIGDSVKVVKAKPFLYGYDFISKVSAVIFSIIQSL